MDQQKKLYAAIGILVLLGGLLFFQRQGEHKDAAQHSIEGQSAHLPKIEVTEETTKTIDRVVIHKPAGKEGGAAEDIELVKTGEDAWSLEKPAKAKANASNVKSLLENLPKLSLSEAINERATRRRCTRPSSRVRTASSTSISARTARAGR
jgi:hypothetical protein